MGITVTMRTDGHAQQKLRAMAMRARSPEKAWPKVGSYLSAVNRRQFATNGGYLGTPWKPLKPDYLLWKVREGYSSHTLIQTGAMRLSFTSRPMAIEVYSGNKARFGSDHPLAAFHQRGTHRNGKRAVPARPIMRVTPKVRKDVKDIIADYILGKRVTVMDRL